MEQRRIVNRIIGLTIINTDRVCTPGITRLRVSSQKESDAAACYVIDDTSTIINNPEEVSTRVF